MAGREEGLFLRLLFCGSVSLRGYAKHTFLRNRLRKRRDNGIMENEFPETKYQETKEKRQGNKKMAIEIVREYLKKWNADSRILEFPVSSATVELAAQAVGCEPARIAKTLSFLVGDHAILIVAAGDAKIDNPKYKGIFHTKAKMLSADQVTDLIGHAVGGVCPFGVKEGVEVYLDESLRRFETVFPAAGSSNSAIEVTMEQLEQYSGSTNWIDVCKGWQEAL